MTGFPESQELEETWAALLTSEEMDISILSMDSTEPTVNSSGVKKKKKKQIQEKLLHEGCDISSWLEFPQGF